MSAWNVIEGPMYTYTWDFTPEKLGNTPLRLREPTAASCVTLATARCGHTEPGARRRAVPRTNQRTLIRTSKAWCPHAHEIIECAPRITGVNLRALALGRLHCGLPSQHPPIN
ncbi:hypothetical protein A0H81_04441 [Grifola frondosa]|uniref:Uncharacterized protein n=1 Tax=Grifola frondosa TaxID=5627 RepID=A0A1C7MGA4_GRIFR|nr:hypothetical protein A0H81_04441 [Grifola frondosa]